MDMIRQFILKPIVDFMFARETFEELSDTIGHVQGHLVGLNAIARRLPSKPRKVEQLTLDDTALSMFETVIFWDLFV